MQHQCSASSESGFTLIEVLIAIAIFSIGLMAVGALQARSLMGTGEVTRKTGAWAILDDQVSQLKALPFYQDAATRTFSPGLDDTAGGFTHTRNIQMNGNYTVHWRVDDDRPVGKVAPTELPGLPAGAPYTVSKTIEVVVTRQGANPATRPIAQAQFVKAWAATDL